MPSALVICGFCCEAGTFVWPQIAISVTIYSWKQQCLVVNSLLQRIANIFEIDLAGEACNGIIELQIFGLPPSEMEVM